MDEIEMQQRPLLDDNASSPSFPLASRKPLDLNAPRSSSKTKRPAMSPVRVSLSLSSFLLLDERQSELNIRLRATTRFQARFCLGFCSFLALVISGAFVYTIYGLVGAVANPHGSHHANATLVAASESKAELVRPFFDPDGRGRLESFDLGVMVHARWDDLPETEALTEEKAGQDVEEAKQEDGQDAAPVQFTMQPWMDTKLPIKPTRPNIGRWQQVFRQVVLRNVSISTKPVQTSVPVTIPGDLMYGLFAPSVTCARDTRPDEPSRLDAAHLSATLPSTRSWLLPSLCFRRPLRPLRSSSSTRRTGRRSSRRHRGTLVTGGSHPRGSHLTSRTQRQRAVPSPSFSRGPRRRTICSISEEGRT